VKAVKQELVFWSTSDNPRF